MKSEVQEGHVLDVLATMPEESVHCVVTSPPYCGLRFYGDSAQAQWGGYWVACPQSWDGELGRERGRTHVRRVVFGRPCHLQQVLIAGKPGLAACPHQSRCALVAHRDGAQRRAPFQPAEQACQAVAPTKDGERVH